MRRRLVLLLASAGLACAAGCVGTQSMLNPAGPQAGSINWLWWVMFGITGAVYLLVVAFLFYAVFVGRRRQGPAEGGGVERRLAIGVGGAVAISVVLLFVLLVASVATGKRIASLGRRAAVTIKITGHQWWWEAEYQMSPPSDNVTTANEIHIPVGEPVALKLTSADVIHSFWVPNLHGKRDLIPGQVNAFWIQADHAGVYRGQCAEYCGYQHAKMGLIVIAEPRGTFEEWLRHQRLPAAEPANESARRGEKVFLNGPCVQCHAIRGTPAGASVAPDLTHLASRETIAAGALPNKRGPLGGWIVDPQQVKPGNRMPPIGLPAEDLQALLTYLEGLK